MAETRVAEGPQAGEASGQPVSPDGSALAARAIEAIRLGVLITDAQGVIRWVNQAFVNITGFTRDEAIGQPASLLNSGRHERAFFEELWKELTARGSWEGEVLNRRKSGEVFPEQLTITAQRGASGEVEHYVGVFSDISQRKHAEERIRHLAQHDPLTDLPNRAMLRDRAAVAFARAHRENGRVALFFVDVDRFKHINDSLGHEAGDRLLVQLSHRIVQSVRASDTVCRVGGDEFVALVSDVESVDHVARAAARLVEVASSPIRVVEQELSLTASVGVAIYPDDGLDLDALLRNADAAMTTAKSSGRNGYRFYSPTMNAQALERLSLEQALRRGIVEGQLRLVYQPKVDLVTRKTVGVEALVRWHLPQGGVISPARFIPVAEESGLIVALGTWVLGEACRQARSWLDLGLPPTPVAVNVSSTQFRQAGFVGAVLDALGVADLPPNLLDLEVTESVGMADAEEVLSRLRQLRQIGVRISLDDFGTGYSSLSYLRRFPIDRLKIDRSFIMELESSRDAATIAKTIVGMGHGLGMRVVAEGVETEAQAAVLREMGCDEAQGYLFARPTPPDELAEKLLDEAGITE